MGIITKHQVAERARKELQKSYFTKDAKVILDEKVKLQAAEEKFDIFLSHSYSDKDYILGVSGILTDLGYSVYIDWKVDQQLSRNEVSRQTANTLRLRMEKDCKCLLYVTSHNSNDSKWMPWELGYFDGKKGRVAILPILDQPQQTQFRGVEYLSLYPYVTVQTALNTTTDYLWVHESPGKYVRFDFWLNGKEPYVH